MISGFLTEEGYKIKKAQLGQKQAEYSGGTGCSTSAIAEVIRKNPAGIDPFNPSQTASAAMGSRGRGRGGSRTTKQFSAQNEKSLLSYTIIDCQDDVLVVPKEKMKLELRKQNRVNLLLVNKEDSEKEIKKKIVDVFPHFANGSIQFLCATRSNDRFQAKQPPTGYDEWTGVAVSVCYSSGTIYIRLAAKPKVQLAAVQPSSRQPVVYATVLHTTSGHYTYVHD